MTTSSHWYEPLRQVASLGSRAARPGSLAGLHAARQEHQGQFFTPDAIVALMWRIITPAMESALTEARGGRVALLDNSVGTGRMFQFANPEQHTLAGCDPHEPSIEAMATAAEDAGFHVDFQAIGMERLRPAGFNVGLVNPPFSLHLDSPLLDGLCCTTVGTYGPHSSAISHAYALEQAILACEIVVAVLPTPYAETLATGDYADQLRAVIRLPAGSFREEGTEVSVSLAIFSDGSGAPPALLTMAALTDALPDLPLHCSVAHRSRPVLRRVDTDNAGPAISRPVTGDTAVRVTHDGRKLFLGFSCGLIEAKTRNALMRHRLAEKRPDGGRYPRGIRWAGQGAYDLELYLAQSDPLAAFQELLDRITAAGGTPQPDPGIAGYLKRRHAAQRRQATPFRRTALVTTGEQGTGTLTARARRAVQCDPNRWGSAVFRAGDEATFRHESGSYTAAHPKTGEVLTMEGRAFDAAFEVLGTATAEPTWQTIHPGRAAVYPKLARDVRDHLTRSGVDEVTGWGFQVDDLVELRLARHGVVAWTMGLGKTRAALGLCLSGGQHNLIVVEAMLVGELVDQIDEIGLSPDLWQVIESPADCVNLRKINIISYSRLRMPVCQGAGRRTFGRLLRRRVHTLVADEAHLLRSSDTAQTRAIYMISPKCRFPMTGTPVANYIRDLRPLIGYVGGDGTAIQQYGQYRPHMVPALLHDMTMAAPGVDVFRDRHVVTEWVTNLFAENMSTGAKREVPKVKQLGLLREWAAPFVLRRVADEPEVAPYVKTPPFAVVHHVVPWDQDHLAYWLKMADEFASWYRDLRTKQGVSGAQINLIALLARIGAILLGSNYPQFGVKGFPYRGGLTSKQRFVIDRAQQLAAEGHKTVIFVENPGLANLFASGLKARGLEAISLTGEINVTERRQLIKHFRHTDAPVLCATYGVGGTGLNLPEADRAIFASRTWTTKTENQARYRLLRPQQTRRVVFETVELEGSLDTYQAMMLMFKNDATNAAVDFLEPQLEEAEFLHLDTVIESFVESLAASAGVSSTELRRSLCHGV